MQSIASHSLRNTQTSADAKEAIETRLLALSRAHNVLGEENWEGASLREIVTRVLEPFAKPDSDRLRLWGPDQRLRPRAALSLALVLNELATNAAKYGALSTAEGHVNLVWALIGVGADRALRLRWRESGGPPVALPLKQGFGTTLIERSIRHELKGTTTLAYEPSGLLCTIEIPASALSAAPDTRNGALAAE